MIISGMMSLLNSIILNDMEKIQYLIQNQLLGQKRKKFQESTMQNFKHFYIDFQVQKQTILEIHSKFQIQDLLKKIKILFLMDQMSKFNLSILMIINGMINWLMNIKLKGTDLIQFSTQNQSQAQKRKKFQVWMMQKLNNS